MLAMPSAVIEVGVATRLLTLAVLYSATRVTVAVDAAAAALAIQSQGLRWCQST